MHCLFIGKSEGTNAINHGTNYATTYANNSSPLILHHLCQQLISHLFFSNNSSSTNYVDLINWLYILPPEDFDDLIKSSHLIICDSSILSILVIFMLLKFLLCHKRICTIYTYQYWLVWSKHLLGFSLCEPSENPHFHLPPLRE